MSAVKRRRCERSAEDNEQAYPRIAIKYSLCVSHVHAAVKREHPFNDKLETTATRRGPNEYVQPRVHCSLFFLSCSFFHRDSTERFNSQLFAYPVYVSI